MNGRNPKRYNPFKPAPSNMGVKYNQNSQIPQNNSLPFPQKHVPLPVRSGPCVVCKSPTVLVCQRCDDFYCSPSCQVKDWPKHRYICFRMPPLINSSSALTQDMPSLNGYLKSEIPSTVSVDTSTKSSQNVTSISKNYSSPTQMQQQQQQQEQTQQHKQQSDSEIYQKNDKIYIGRIEHAAFPKNNSSVLLTSFRTSNRVFIRSIETSENAGYCEVIKKINEYGKTAGPLKTLPSRNAFAITDFNNDNLFYRVQIISVKNENEIKVIYYDFGNEATKKLSELKVISKECAQLKQFIMLVSLKGVPFIRDCEKLNEYIKSFEETEATIVYDEKKQSECELIPWGAGESVNKKINLFIKLQKSKVMKEGTLKNEEETNTQKSPAQNTENSIHPKSDLSISSKLSQLSLASDGSKNLSSQVTKPVMNPPFETEHLPVGQRNLDVMVVDNSLLLFGCFACVLCADKENLQKIQKYLSEYEDNGNPYKPKADEYCLAKFEGSWYRAKALEILSDEYVEIVFIDFLNETQVSVKCIRRYPMDLDCSCKTSLCMIDDLPSELSDNIVDILKEKLQPGTEHRINEVKGVEEDAPDVFVVKMHEVVKWLNN